MQQTMQLGLLKLQQIKESGEYKRVAEAQKNIAGIVAKDADSQAQLQRIKASQI